MGLLSGILEGPNKNASTNSSSSTSNTTNTTINTDKRQVVDGGGLGITSDSSTVNVTESDHDSIKQAFDLAKTSSAIGLNSIQDAVKFAGDALKVAGTATVAASSGVQSAYQSAADSATGLRFVVGAGLVVALLSALFLFGKHKKAVA